MKLFISGWAGFKEALDVPEDWYFINPFLDLDEEGILNFLKAQSGEIVVGWSTGGHIILKNLEFFSERFDEIVIVAGFKKFTDYVNPRVIKRMLNKMQTEPEVVVKDFLINAGCEPLLPEKINYDLLIEGLLFLLNSNIEFCPPVYRLILIHGRKDKIVPFQASYDLREFYPQSKIYLVEGEHWLTFRKIEKFFHMPR